MQRTICQAFELLSTPGTMPTMISEKCRNKIQQIDDDMQPTNYLHISLREPPAQSEVRVGCRAVPVGRGGGSVSNTGRDPQDDSSKKHLETQGGGRQKHDRAKPLPVRHWFRPQLCHMLCALELRLRYMPCVIYGLRRLLAANDYEKQHGCSLPSGEAVLQLTLLDQTMLLSCIPILCVR